MSLTEEIKKLKSLLEQSAISKKEYDILLKQVIDDFVGVQEMFDKTEDESLKKEAKADLDSVNLQGKRDYYEDINEKLLCPKCQKVFPAGSKFCDIDGSLLVSSEKCIRRCIKCGTEYPLEVNFCPKDGCIIEVV